MSRTKRDFTFYVLSLNRKNIRLYEANQRHIKRVELKNFPTNLEDALQIDEYPQARELHPIAPSSKGKQSEGYHSQFNVKQTNKIMLEEFFRRIDQRLHGFLNKQKKPLVIAGVNYILPIYRKVNTYQGLISDAIKGNQEHVSPLVLREKAWSVVDRSTMFKRSQRDVSHA